MLATAAPQNPKNPILNAVPAETTTRCCEGALTTATGSQFAPSQRKRPSADKLPMASGANWPGVSLTAQ